MLSVKTCPLCGATLDKGVYKCKYCGAQAFIASVAYLNNYDATQIQKYIRYYKDLIDANPDDDRGYLGLGICYLQLSMFLLAKTNLKKAMDLAPENPSVYYYYCLAVIGGQRIRALSFDTVEELVMYLNTSINMDPNNPLYLILMMLIKHDYYVLNSLKEPRPTYAELADFLKNSTVTIDSDELNRLKSCVKVADFAEFDL